MNCEAAKPLGKPRCLQCGAVASYLIYALLCLSACEDRVVLGVVETPEPSVVLQRSASTVSSGVAPASDMSAIVAPTSAIHDEPDRPDAEAEREGEHEPPGGPDDGQMNSVDEHH
jgi:hypothetical protein